MDNNEFPVTTATLSATWTSNRMFDHSQDTILNKYIQTLSKLMAEEIDFEIKRKIYIDSGWTEVKVDVDVKLREAAEWCIENLAHEFCKHSATWLFESKEDAAMFILRWA